MKIGIDARFLTHPQLGGFKSYTESLVAALARIDSENEYFLYTDREFGDLVERLNNSKFHCRVVPTRIPSVGVPWREQVSLRRHAANDQVDVFHSPCLTAPLNIGCPLVVTIHDMIWAFPNKYSHSKSLSVKRKLMEIYNRIVPKYAIQRADAIITVSNASRNSILEYSQQKHENIVVTHEAPNPFFRQVNDEQAIKSICVKHGLPPNFILAIGSADPRKNIRGLAEAYSLLPNDLKERFRLVVVWTHSFLAGELSEFVEGLHISDHVHFITNVPNDDLVLLYNAAALFAFPSLYEGFGLPPLEAMACGAPVVAADNSSIPEIVDDAAILFSAQDTEEMSSVMDQVLRNNMLRQSLSKKGIERAAAFSWYKCARETVAVYQAVYRK